VEGSLLTKRRNIICRRLAGFYQFEEKSTKDRYHGPKIPNINEGFTLAIEHEEVLH